MSLPVALVSETYWKNAKKSIRVFDPICFIVFQHFRRTFGADKMLEILMVFNS